MTKKFYKDAFGWGFMLWVIGYALGMILFLIAPPFVIGWVIMPIGVVVTLWVLWKKVKADSLKYYALIAFVWVLIAIVFDYFFLVKAFKPADGYYKLDVYLYYALTFLLPMIVGWQKKGRRNFVNNKLKNMKGFIGFIRKQGVVGLAVGFILGGAVSKVVSALVSDIINPILGLALGAAGDLKTAALSIGTVKILYGDLISVVIDFLVVAGVVYFGVKWLKLDKLDKKD